MFRRFLALLFFSRASVTGLMVSGAATVWAASNEIKMDEADIQGVTQAAQAATKVFFPRAENRKAVFGFDSGDRLESAVLKSPIRLYEIKDADVAAYRPGQPISQLLKPTGQWFVPVAIGGTNRAMIAVIATGEGKWEGSTFGLAPLARKWQNIETWWPATEKFTPQLVILTSAQGYFFTIPQIEPANLTALLDLPAAHLAAGSTPKPQLTAVGIRLEDMRTTLQHSPKTEPVNNTTNTSPNENHN